MSDPIEDYALIGDCETAALISRSGSIDWLCWPRFDSSAMFAALLGNSDNGRWGIAVVDDNARISRKYVSNTLVLETEIETPTGSVTLTEFMPLRADGSTHIVRIVRGGKGPVRMTTELVMRFDYGSIVPWVTRVDGTSIKAIAGPNMVILRSDVELKADGMTHRAEFTVRPGETVSFVMGFASSFGAQPPALIPADARTETEAAWHKWAGQHRCEGPYEQIVLRSLITLKALTYRPTGGIVAAATTSIPELIGGSRNWDYRYCWLRDATFTLLALMNCGFASEAEAWRTWLRHAVAGDPGQVQIMYGLAGERRLDEWEVPWLAGYADSKPVRIGNAAANQLQLDIFGEVMDALFQSDNAKGASTAGWDLQRKLIEHLETIWREPDEGLWEVRGPRRNFVHSKVMAWVAFDRAVKSVERFQVEGPVEQWREIRDEIHAQVCEQGYSTKVGSFVQSYGSEELDASALLIPLVGFLPSTDPRIRKTVEAIGSRLQVNGLVRRYETAKGMDGLLGDEGAFLACSFWYADNLMLLGRLIEARELFERLISLCNDVGLLAEEYDPVSGRMLGNFPQAFSHVALINTAHNLSKADKPAEQRSGKMRIDANVS